jgi:hypothetical protein
MDSLGRRPELSSTSMPLPERLSRDRLVFLWAFVLIFAGLPALVSAGPLKKDWRLEPFEWHGSLGAGRLLSVRNPYGDVRARRSEGADIAVYAVMQRHRDDPREWKIAITAAGDDLAIEVVFAAGTVPADAAAGWGPRRVDMTVYVPAGARLQAETTAGLIEAKRLGGDVQARTAAGEIVITTSGNVDARSEEGRIRYSFLDSQWVGSARLVTRSGDIKVTLPRGANVALAIDTRGEISTDGALAPSAGPPLPDPPRHGFKAVFGAGGSPVAVESESGKVEVRQM